MRTLHAVTSSGLRENTLQSRDLRSVQKCAWPDALQLYKPLLCVSVPHWRMLPQTKLTAAVKWATKWSICAATLLCCAVYAAVLCCRHQWYQLGNKVVIDVYAKNLPKDAVAVQLSGSDNDKLHICIKAQPSSSTAPAAADEDYVLDLHLFDKVGSDASQPYWEAWFMLLCQGPCSSQSAAATAGWQRLCTLARAALCMRRLSALIDARSWGAKPCVMLLVS